VAETSGAFVASFALAVLTGGWIIKTLSSVGVRQTVSADAPARHSEKQGTPTMGGLIILLAMSAPVVVDMILRPNRLSAIALPGRLPDRNARQELGIESA
jgi:UDP-N-acetylmuramyl pentapeptide phosphotransferase/UDP-N-acetylglucosamine-1-phosphate transferase